MHRQGSLDINEVFRNEDVVKPKLPKLTRTLQLLRQNCLLNDRVNFEAHFIVIFLFCRNVELNKNLNFVQTKKLILV